MGYRNPTDTELKEIEHRISAVGMPVRDFMIDASEFGRFRLRYRSPPGYHRGEASEVYAEKLFEHFIAWKMLGLARAERRTYADIAACSSTWAHLLRSEGIKAFATDLQVHPDFRHLDYYLCEDATRSGFAFDSIDLTSLQCAYEMFLNIHDIDLLRELSRILSPGGKVVICPSICMWPLAITRHRSSMARRMAIRMQPDISDGTAGACLHRASTLPSR